MLNTLDSATMVVITNIEGGSYVLRKSCEIEGLYVLQVVADKREPEQVGDEYTGRVWDFLEEAGSTSFLLQNPDGFVNYEIPSVEAIPGHLA